MMLPGSDKPGKRSKIGIFVRSNKVRSSKVRSSDVGSSNEKGNRGSSDAIRE